ncbi:invasion-associated locus B family protein [Zhengella mangrovi]|uniref:Invasion-associated locus B family protein n=1 Tax=Zhengella mangrovi TaxID=1982044 RepID=A0A2G1QK25_9HYPH|nr:invasion associated locus B family protein [Zhengella mangrovi]PHP65876.1 invasion-associated locus B family protein [Zhengella mangrovi]
MKKLTLAAFALALAGMAPATPASAQQRDIPEGWFKLCQKQKDSDVCNVQFIKAAKETGQLLVGISLIELSGKAQRRIIQITVPPMRILPPGIGLQIDGGKTAKLDYVICPIQPSPSCIAEAPLTDEIINSFKRGGELTITAVNFQNQPTPVKVTLSGFTEAYDGEPIKQSDYEERQKKLQEEIAKRQEEFQKKLQAEQDKAKSN